MLSFNFYESFLDYKYILIYQLDAFVFKDDLIFWCNKNYDYVGAPWIASISNNPFTLLLNKISSIFDSKEKKERKKIFFKVGNGGFSLRKVASHYQISKENEKYIKELLISKREEFDYFNQTYATNEAEKIWKRIDSYVKPFSEEKKYKIIIGSNSKRDVTGEFYQAKRGFREGKTGRKTFFPVEPRG